MMNFWSTENNQATDYDFIDGLLTIDTLQANAAGSSDMVLFVNITTTYSNENVTH